MPGLGGRNKAGYIQVDHVVFVEKAFIVSAAGDGLVTKQCMRVAGTVVVSGQHLGSK